MQYAALHIGLHRQHVVAGALPVRKQFENLPLKPAPHNKLNPKSALYISSLVFFNNTDINPHLACFSSPTHLPFTLSPCFEP